jgi:hypothetical protein
MDFHATVEELLYTVTLELVSCELVRTSAEEDIVGMLPGNEWARQSKLRIISMGCSEKLSV